MSRPRQSNDRMGWRRRVAASLAVAVVLGAPALFAASAAPAPAWPESAAGRLGDGWVEAFNRGEPAMRRFFVERLAAASLAERGMEERMASYRSLRELVGRLNLVEVVTAEPHAVTVVLRGRDELRHELTFVAEAEAPHGLLAVSARVTQRHGHAPH
jgi:hypothetical protein